jgi:hypothetical protein
MDAFSLLDEKRYEIGNHNIYGQIFRNARFDESDRVDRPGILLSKFERR